METEKIETPPVDLSIVENAAYAAMQWGSGRSQKEIARELGHKSPTVVCLYIERFLHRYFPDAPRTEFGTLNVQGAARKALVAEAVGRYRDLRNKFYGEDDIPLVR